MLQQLALAVERWGRRGTMASLSLSLKRDGEGERKALQVVFGLWSNSQYKLRFYWCLFHKRSHVLCGLTGIVAGVTSNAAGCHVGVQSLWVLQKHRISVEKYKNLMLLLSWAQTQLIKSREREREKPLCYLKACFWLFLNKDFYPTGASKLWKWKFEERWKTVDCETSAIAPFSLRNSGSHFSGIVSCHSISLHILHLPPSTAAVAASGYLLSRLLLMLSWKLPPSRTSWAVSESSPDTHSSLYELDLVR